MKYTIEIEDSFARDIERRAEKRHISPEKWIQDNVEAYCAAKLMYLLRRQQHDKILDTPI